MSKKRTRAGRMLLEIHLSAFRRVEYTEVIEVPADITEAELHEVLEDRFDRVDEEEYSEDQEYWVQGQCYSTAASPDADPSQMAYRLDGSITVESAHISSIVFGEKGDGLKTMGDATISEDGNTLAFGGKIYKTAESRPGQCAGGKRCEFAVGFQCVLAVYAGKRWCSPGERKDARSIVWIRQKA